MKIALIGNDYIQQFPVIDYGGIESCVENLAQGLHKNKVEFFAIAPKRSSIVNYDFEVHETDELPTSHTQKNSFSFAYSAAKILKELKFDAIWSQSHWGIEPFLEFNKPIISTFHDSNVKQYGWIKKYSRTKFRFLSKFQFNNLVTESWESDISFQLYSGLEEKEFHFNPQKEDYYLWCGGLNWGLQAKGLDIFIELAKNNKNKNFIAYGSGNLELEEYLRNLNISNFQFKGGLNRGEEHRNVFSKAKALIMPTKIMDTLPRTCLEAVSKGTPIIGSPNGSLPEIISATGGKVCNTLEEYSDALGENFNYKDIHMKSNIFSIDEEVRGMLRKTYE